MPQEDPWTIGRLLTWTTDFLKARGVDGPRLEAEVLLAHAVGCERIGLYTAFGQEVSEAVRAAFRDLVRRRAAGEPTAYLVGHREFYSLRFEVTPAVLIPRPETELLIVALLDRVREMDSAAGQRRSEIAIADVGTGSGILAVCAARHLPQAAVTAIDISPEALAVARRNAERHGVAERIEMVESDLLAALPAGRQFDFVLSNPPYVSEDEFRQLDRDVKDHEPRRALVAGPTGTEVIQRLLPQAAERLCPGGTLLLEVSPMIAASVEQIVREHPQMVHRETIRDLAGHARVVRAERQDP